MGEAMRLCELCKHAELDYEAYYGTEYKEWFVTGCKKNQEPEECDCFDTWDVDNERTD